MQITDVSAEASRRFRLGDLKRGGQRSAFQEPVLTGFNLGNRTLTLTLAMEKFREITEIANEARMKELGSNEIAQRPLDEKHAKAIAFYMLRGLLVDVKNGMEERGDDIPTALEDILFELGEGPYQGLQPFTGNIRACDPGGADLEIEEVSGGRLILHLRQGQLIFIIDGQHRRWAYGLLVTWLRDIIARGMYTSSRRGGLYEPQRDDLELRSTELEIWSQVFNEAITHCTVDLTVHLGLNVEEERQLFHDLNNLGKKVDPSIAQQFDQANPISVFVRKVIESEKLLGEELVILDQGVRGRRGRQAFGEPSADGIRREDLIDASAMLFAGQMGPTGVTPSKVQPYYDYGRRFWRVLAAQRHFGEPGWHERTLLAQPVMIKALAQLAYAFHASREANEQHLESFFRALEQKLVNFEQTEPLWHVYLLAPSERYRTYPKLIEYLTPDSVMQPYATCDEGTKQLRFGNNSRDIARYLGDLIRANLGLPVRPGLISLRQKLAAQSGNTASVSGSTGASAQNEPVAVAGIVNPASW